MYGSIATIFGKNIAEKVDKSQSEHTLLSRLT